MPKKPRQIHLARNVSQKFFELYETVSTCRARVRALANEYDIVFDDSPDASDPYVDHDYARGLGGQVIDAQKELLQQLEVMDQYSARTGYRADPALSTQIIDKTASQRNFLYTTDIESELASKIVHRLKLDMPWPNERTKSTKKVRFAEIEPISPSGRGGKFIKLVTDKVGDIAYKTCQTISPLQLSRVNIYDAVLEYQPSEEKSKGKRLSSNNHYELPQPTKLQKIWHENVWPEAYSFEDVGSGLDRPMTMSEADSAGMPVPQPKARRPPYAKDDMWQCLVNHYKSRTRCYNSKSSVERNDLANPGLDLVVYRQKPIIAVPTTQSSISMEDAPALVEVKNNAATLQKHGSRAIRKLQLPCSVQVTTLESRGAIV